MSPWNHVLCWRCWKIWIAMHGQPGRTPIRVKDSPLEPCCFCEEETDAGIFVRIDPKLPALRCGESSRHLQENN